MIKVISKLLEDGWNVAYRQLPEGEILDDTNTPFWIIPNTWRTWEADPFVFQHDGKIYIFADNCLDNQRKSYSSTRYF